MRLDPSQLRGQGRTHHRMPREWRFPDGRVPTGSGVSVAVIDSGWDRSLSVPGVLPGVGFVSSTDDLAMGQTGDDQDRIGHGTSCIDLLLQLAPAVNVLPVRVFGARLETSTATIEASLRWAIERRVNVVNLSLGTLRLDARNRLYRVCADAYTAGIILVAAAPSNRVAYPSGFDLVLSVGLGDWKNPFVFSYSQGQMIECRSPGHCRHTIGLAGARVRMSGTSFAVPNITGIVALWIERWPGLTLEDIRGLLSRYARKRGCNNADDQSAAKRSQ